MINIPRKLNVYQLLKETLFKTTAGNLIPASTADSFQEESLDNYLAVSLTKPLTAETFGHPL